ncbi:restriction endonuclease subunit S [Acinetobacter seifertii]|nr:restriction endonuclease subunit S [Acinetobacter seifertii]
MGGGREGLNFQAIRSIDFEIPSKEEQTKIASFYRQSMKRLLNSRKSMSYSVNINRA